MGSWVGFWFIWENIFVLWITPTLLPPLLIFQI